MRAAGLQVDADSSVRRLEEDDKAAILDSVKDSGLRWGLLVLPPPTPPTPAPRPPPCLVLRIAPPAQLGVSCCRVLGCLGSFLWSAGQWLHRAGLIPSAQVPTRVGRLRKCLRG